MDVEGIRLDGLSQGCGEEVCVEAGPGGIACHLHQRSPTAAMWPRAVPVDEMDGYMSGLVAEHFAQELRCSLAQAWM